MTQSENADVQRFTHVTDLIMRKYGKNGSGRASALRLVGVYYLYRQGGYKALREYGFSRHSIQLYIEKLNDAGVFTT